MAWRMQPEEVLKSQKPLLVKTKNQPGGVAGNMHTIKVMRQVAHDLKGHPTIRALALAILNYYGVKSQDYVDEAKAIGKYVQNKVQYVKDPLGIEQLHNPIMLIEQIQRGVARGDCDDMSLLIATLLLSIGHQPYFKIVRFNSTSGSYNHIYVVDKTNNNGKPKQDVHIDAIIKTKPIGFEVPHKSCKEIKV